MKILLLSVFLIAASISRGQENFDFKLIDSPQFSKAQLYVNAKSFLVSAFKSSKDVIQMDDKEAGKIICKGYMMPVANVGLGIKKENTVQFIATIDIKENKYRCVLSDFRYVDGGYNKPLESEAPSSGAKFWQRLKDATRTKAIDFLAGMQTSMNKKIVTEDF